MTEEHAEEAGVRDSVRLEDTGRVSVIRRTLARDVAESRSTPRVEPSFRWKCYQMEHLATEDCVTVVFVRRGSRMW